jgi:hypothetical protein
MNALQKPRFLLKTGAFVLAWMASLLHITKEIEEGVLKP